MASDRTRRRAVVLGVVVTVAVLVLYLSGGIGSRLRSGAGLIEEPFSWVVEAIGRPIGHLFAGAISYSDVVAQNQELRHQLGEEELKANEVWPLERQLQQLTTTLNIPFVGSLPTEVAQVTTNSPTNFAATFDISKGRDDGVLAGMPVVANGGLIGRVTSTTAHGATVLLISDTSSVVGASWSATSPDVLVYGRGVNNNLSVSSVSITNNLRPGTVLSTDGLQGGLFPPGLPIATVKNITLTPGASTYDLVLSPLADLKHLSYVDVVMWEPST